MKNMNQAYIYSMMSLSSIIYELIYELSLKMIDAAIVGLNKENFWFHMLI